MADVLASCSFVFRMQPERRTIQMASLIESFVGGESNLADRHVGYSYLVMSRSEVQATEHRGSMQLVNRFDLLW